MEGKGNFFILLFVVAFLSLTLALLACYVFFFAGNSPKPPSEPVQSSEEKRPADDELATISLFDGKKIFNLKNNSDKPEANKSMAAIQVSVQIQYFKKVKGIKSVEEKIMAYDGAIKELVGNYFLNMTLEEVSQTATKEKAKKELTEQINALLTSSEEGKKDIVYTLIFDEWFFQ